MALSRALTELGPPGGSWAGQEEGASRVCLSLTFQENRSLTIKLRKRKPEKKVEWTSDTVDNEHMGRRSSKCEWFHQHLLTPAHICPQAYLLPFHTCSHLPTGLSATCLCLLTPAQGPVTATFSHLLTPPHRPVAFSHLFTPAQGPVTASVILGIRDTRLRLEGEGERGLSWDRPGPEGSGYQWGEVGLWTLANRRRVWGPESLGGWAWGSWSCTGEASYY